ASCPKPGPGPGTGAPPPGVVAERALNPDAEKAFLSKPAPPASGRVVPPEREPFNFVVDGTQPAGAGTTYMGHVEGAASSSATIVVIESAISGSIRILGRNVYVIGTGPDGRPIIR